MFRYLVTLENNHTKLHQDKKDLIGLVELQGETVKPNPTTSLRCFTYFFSSLNLLLQLLLVCLT